MAVNNRTEAISAATSALVPTLTLTQHLNLLENSVLNSTVFEKDIIASETVLAGAVTVDYATKDMATCVTAVNLAVSFTGLENGAVKYLSVTKAAANTVSFVGATDVSMRKGYINSTVTVVVYRISNKNGGIYVESINIDNNVIERKIIDIGDWNMDITVTLSPILHGLDFTKIRGASALIRNDANSSVINLMDQLGAVATIIINATQVILTRETSGIFDNTNYDSTSYNRGWIIIDYIA